MANAQAPQQPGPGGEVASSGDGVAEALMLAGWREHLAILAGCAGNRPGDEALIVRLGDRLWAQRGLVLSLYISPAFLSQHTLGHAALTAHACS